MRDDLYTRAHVAGNDLFNRKAVRDQPVGHDARKALASVNGLARSHLTHEDGVGLLDRLVECGGDTQEQAISAGNHEHVTPCDEQPVSNSRACMVLGRLRLQRGSR